MAASALAPKDTVSLPTVLSTMALREACHQSPELKLHLALAQLANVSSFLGEHKFILTGWARTLAERSDSSCTVGAVHR